MIKLGSVFCVCLFIYIYFLRNAELKKSKKKKTNIGDLPEDLLLEIFSRLPAASFVSASKVWKALIKDGRFAKQKSQIIMFIDFRVYLASIDLHGGHDNVVEVTSKFSLKDSSKEVDIREVFHCDGLLLCTTGDNRLVVCNPCSGETNWIKPTSSYEKLDVYALGKASCNKYKILRIALHLFGCRLEPRLYEVYDFTSNSWRVVDESREWSILGLGRRGTSVDGNTYWLAFSSSYHSHAMWMDILQSFDFSTERFGSVSLPVDVLSYSTVIALSVTREEQKLCLLATRDDNVYDIDVWIATKIEGTGSAAMSWAKLLTVERANDSQFLMFCTGMSFLADQESKVLVCPGRNCSNSNSFLHIVGGDTYIQVDHHDAGSQCSLLLSYVPSLVQIQ